MNMSTATHQFITKEQSKYYLTLTKNISFLFFKFPGLLQHWESQLLEKKLSSASKQMLLTTLAPNFKMR